MSESKPRTAEPLNKATLEEAIARLRKNNAAPPAMPEEPGAFEEWAAEVTAALSKAEGRD